MKEVKPAIKELAELTGAENVAQLCDFFGYSNAADFFRLLKEKEAAQLIGKSVATLQNWRHYGQGPNYVKSGASVGYMPIDLHLFNFRNVVRLQQEVTQ